MTAERAKVSSARDTTTMTVGDFLLRRIREAGVGHAFGVPGDFNLEFLQQMEDSGTLDWIGTCNELNASYAADGYARLNGMAALVVTQAVGALSAINGVAGSYSEHVPVICVCGSIPLRSIERGLSMHHTMADGTWDRFLTAYAQVTAAAVRLTPDNAATEIDRLIRTAWHDKLPVYMELPSDIAYLDIEVPADPLVLAEPRSDPERVRSCADAIADRLSKAKSPAVLVDLDAARYGAAGEVMGLAEKMQLPVAVVATAKGVIDETFPHYIGIYAGAASQPHVRKSIEGSDCLLSINYRPIDLDSGSFTASLPASTICARGHSVDVGEDNFQAVTLREVLRSVTETVPQVTNRATRHFAPTAPTGNGADGSAKLTQAAYWQAIQGYIRSGDVLIAEDGTSYAAFGLQLPPKCSFVSQVIWGSIGYTVGSLLGTLTAAPDRRHLLFVGDGSFQLTAQELSTILRHDHKPVIFLINNGGYTVERGYLGKNSRFNDIADWSYADLPKVFKRNTTARSFVVKTVADLEKALSAPNDSLIFIESVMDPFDAPVPVMLGGNTGADLDYGPRGPQHRGNMQLRPPS
ncbi:MAG TPA: thiamine pyrophosphate-binding protein [Streptosporangiaceae bacterium]|nr:thiamine pyrophosphate-binding protein [Streptosporangiaceae bacterium]